MSELSILKAFVSAGMTPVGACAMGGNIQAESGFKSNIAQRGMTEMSDAEYTASADHGYILFSRDGVGYGLCQWTYKTRKAALLKFAQGCGKSVGDEAMQTEFCIAELQADYPALWSYLCETQDITEATERICAEYERPAVNNSLTRTMFANNLFMRYGDKLESTIKVNSAENARINRTDVEQNRTSAIGNAQCAMPVIKRGDRSAEARYLADKLAALGYDVLWDGLWACVVDYQGKRGLTVDGVCGEETWAKLMEVRK